MLHKRILRLCIALALVATSFLAGLAWIIAWTYDSREASHRQAIPWPEATCAAMSDNAKIFATGHEDGSIRLWGAISDKRKVLLHGHTSSVNVLAFSPDSETLASGACDGKTILWDLKTGSPRLALKVPCHYVWALAFSSDGKSIYTGDFHGSPSLRKWDVTSGTLIRKLFDSSGPTGIRCVSLSPDGNLVAATGHDWGGSVQIYDERSGKPVALLASGIPDHRVQVSAVKFSPDGKRIAIVGGDDTRLRVWDVSRKKMLYVMDDRNARTTAFTFSPKSDKLAIAKEFGELELWDLRSGRLVGQYESNMEHPMAMVFQDRGDVLAVVNSSPVGLSRIDISRFSK